MEQPLGGLGLREVGGHRGHDLLVSATVTAQRSQPARCATKQGLVLGLEGMQGPADGELVEGRVLGAVGGHRPGSGAAAAPSAPPVISATAPPSSSFSRRMPDSIRVLTVPSGVPVSAATSRWV